MDVHTSEDQGLPVLTQTAQDLPSSSDKGCPVSPQSEQDLPSSVADHGLPVSSQSEQDLRHPLSSQPEQDHPSSTADLGLPVFSPSEQDHPSSSDKTRPVSPLPELALPCSSTDQSHPISSPPESHILSSPETAKTEPILPQKDTTDASTIDTLTSKRRSKSLTKKNSIIEDELCTPTINIAPYMSKFVRQLHAEDEEPIGMPFSYTQFGAVLMVDIVGFSQMTSIASSKGDVGAEMLSSQIGAYFDQAIRIIEYHGGDVVKFLGDALLVVFQADPDIEYINQVQQSESSTADSTSATILSSPVEDPAATLRRNKITVRKAVECGLELLSRLSNYRIYLSEREFSRKLSAQGFSADDLSMATSSGATNEDGGQVGGPCEFTFTVNGEHTTSEVNNTLHPQATSSTGIGSLNVGFGSSGFGFSTLSQSRRSSDANNSTRRSSLLHNSVTPSTAQSMDQHSGSTRVGSAVGGYHRFSLTVPDSPASTRISIKTTPGSVPVMNLPEYAIGSTISVASSNFSNPASASNGTVPVSLGPGGVAGFRKRTESVNSLSTNRPASTSSRNRATTILSSAKTLFTHGNPSDIRPLAGSGFSGAAIGANGVAEGSEGAEDSAASEESHDLQLHMALSAGDIVNIIIGDSGHKEGLENLLIQETGRLEYAICGEQMATIDDALNMARAGEVTITKSAWKYVNADSYPWSEPRRNCFILRSAQTTTVPDTPLLRRVRNEKLLSSPIESNSQYYKYINKSAIHRLILYPDNTFPAQFRNSTILFISLGDVKPWTPEGLAHCQKAILVVHKVTSTYEGFIQQFAVDDKGATLLCAFGLPYPRSHEKEAVFAAKSAWMIRQRFLESGITGFKISLATGVIFTSMIGNEFRRDPAIVGDTIVIAVRILKFEYAIDSIVCDDATRVACISEHDGLCEFEDMGDEYVKGKLHPLRIWRLIHFGAKKQTRRPDDVMVDETIGYEPERERVQAFISAWAALPDHNTILITGPTGSGKSMFYQQIIHLADSLGYQICSAASAEVEKNTEYYQCKFLLLGLFDIMRRHQISYASKFVSREVAPSIADDSANAPDKDASNRIQQGTGLGNNPSAQTASFSDSLVKAIDRRRSSAFSVDMAASPTLSQYGEPSSRVSMSMSMTKLQAFINICLRKMGIADLMMLPVLDDIISTISSDNSTPIIDGPDDEILTDFITKILNYASQFVKIILMFEDIQWCDVKSLGVIRAIHERCPSVLVVLFSKPQRDYGRGVGFQGITNHKGHLEISLEGLKRRDIEIALLRSFKPNGVTSISPEVIDLVQERTKGNPKFVKNMSNILKEFCHVNIVDGELLTTGQDATPSPSSKTMEEMLMKQDRKKMTLMQYDRVRPKFQDFLKIASCLGEKFSLAEVNAIRPLETLLGTPEPSRSYATIISDLDPYRFLSLATDQQANIQFSDNPVLQTIYTFGSGSTAQDIYDSIPYEERVNYHLRMGQFYESFLGSPDDSDSTAESMNGQDLLPQITRHYLKTEYTAKKIKYLKALAAFDLKSNMLTDSSQNLSALIDILDTVPGARESMSPEDLADIYSMKGESLSKRMRIEEAEPALLGSLTQYGIHWPSTHWQWRSEITKQKWKFLFNYFRGATPVHSGNPGKPPKAKVDSKTQVRLQRIIRVFSCLQNIFFWRTQPEAAMLSCLYTLHYCRILGLPSGDQTASLGRIALLLYFRGKKRKCAKYMEDARRMNAAGQTSEGMLPCMDAYVEYCEGRQAEAHQLLDTAIDESKTFGVVFHLTTFYRAVTMKSAYRTWEGGFNVHPEDCQLLRTLSAVAIQNGDSEGETLFAIPTLANLLLQERLRDAESWVVLIEKFIMPKARLMNLLIIHGILSYYYAKLGDYEKSRIYVQLLSENIEQQGVGAHPFPLLACMFTIMSMYEMMENPNKRALPTEEDPQRQKSEKVLSFVIAYLTTDPFKTLADTFICWADAMYSFIQPGHEKEGAEKLFRGYKGLSARLEGINFVKAYFLTQLGRHSDPMMKDEYYKKANRLFIDMSMNPLLWLTDPTTAWRPPPVDEGRYDFIFGDIPMPTNADTLKEGTLGWAAAEATGVSMGPTAEGTGVHDASAGVVESVPVAAAAAPLNGVSEKKQKPAPVVPGKQSQLGVEDPYGRDYVARNFLALDEGSFDWILAEGSSASATRGRIPEAPI
ncbi:hypothetical protein EMPS_09844 [Entomortierella parvispora]|uniref:Guanylate cyclase domain-containing protein n=1 Tax=Entomortierella parvispora TaxID=205924 RepID=A0A9P3M0Z5_9FUNG|nr:hypothetical protein EMPS_09844 [Entomortierella parvispora]